MTKKIKITLFNTSSSGSNTYLLYNKMPTYLLNKYDIRLLTLFEAERDPTVHDSDVYITTHGEYPSSPDKINIELWHGFPLKGMANMDREEPASSLAIHNYWSNLDLIMSYSPLYTTLLNSCMGARITQYRVTGMPRNDALLAPGSREHLVKLFPSIGSNKTVFFMPTFRKSVINPDKIEGGKDFANVFGFEAFDETAFFEYLEQRDLHLIVKLHPFEENFYREKLSKWSGGNVHLLTNSMLVEARLDLYELLGAADMLITDYSSVYFDYLLLKRPILFTPVDLDAYTETRGLLLAPYEFWTPGPKALSQSALQESIDSLFCNPEWFEAERSTILGLTHAYHDNHSSARIWHEIDQYIQQRLTTRSLEAKNQDELIQLKARIKEHITDYIESANWTDALQLIKSYEETAEADAELLSMKGIAQLFGASPKLAIETLLLGHRFYPENTDILYNLAYAYENAGERSSAIHFYTLMRGLTNDANLLVDLEERLQALSS